MFSSLQDALIAGAVSLSVSAGGFLISHNNSIEQLKAQARTATELHADFVSGVQTIQLNNVRQEAVTNTRLALLEACSECSE